MMMGRCFESEHRMTCEILPEIRGSRTYHSRARNQVSRVAVLLFVMLGTCSALPGKPTRKATKKEAATTAAVQQGPDAETIEDNFTQRERLAIMAGATIAVVLTGYSLRRHQQISGELKLVSAEADLLQKRLVKLRSERDEKVGQIASKSGENVRLKTENAQLRIERDHWQRTAQEARALAAGKQYSVEELRKALGNDGGKDA
jgi:hypothetical protein